MVDNLADPSEAREALSACGVSVRRWATANNFSPSTVYAVLNGKSRGLRGESYRAAVALGLKPKATEVQLARVQESVTVARQLTESPLMGG